MKSEDVSKPMIEIQIPKDTYSKIEQHIKNDGIKAHYKHGSVEDFLSTIIKQNIEAERDKVGMNQ